eukprot:scaffold188731_cov21-Tisochrysis_lutea.AAC.2
MGADSRYALRKSAIAPSTRDPAAAPALPNGGLAPSRRGWAQKQQAASPPAPVPASVRTPRGKRQREEVGVGHDES